MKITSSRLREIIQEEIQRSLKEEKESYKEIQEIKDLLNEVSLGLKHPDDYLESDLKRQYEHAKELFNKLSEEIKSERPDQIKVLQRMFSEVGAKLGIKGEEDEININIDIGH